MKTQLLASSPTLEKIKIQICKFYYRESIELTKVSETEWKLPFGSCRVIKKKGRYRFEMPV